MIVYLDASALVKLYVAETGSTETCGLVGRSDASATVVVSRAEVAAALAKAVRLKALAKSGAAKALRAFETDWADLIRLPVTESLAVRAAALAWDYGLRGHDAVHLAGALTWGDSLGEPVVLATYDRQLWQAARTAGLEVWPPEV